MANLKPKWMNKIRKILVNNLNQIDVFVTYLETPEFNATAKWEQLDNKDIETRFTKFMNLWYEQTKDPSLTQIVSALQDMNRNDLVNIIQHDVNLTEQLRKEIEKNVGNDEGTPEFNATAKWEQLNINNPQIETRLCKFMNLWYEHHKHPCLTQIVSVLKDMNRNDLVSVVHQDAMLKEQLNMEKLPIQASENPSSFSKSVGNSVSWDKFLLGIDQICDEFHKSTIYSHKRVALWTECVRGKFSQVNRLFQ
ncbi:hypothetical protein LOTGIDRAFT_170737 [Lottia gigantea]|uniref:Death domain-containing protein n=1 Tax=Lottia gigantea TaxID=225164 RepID=V4B2X9_LOTGI|nr:hypothetical protein LOTGIDRAFT_170737 [Lottia gigantea]ESP04493.1 hypothetical protein LOTGIDRAFT_170737 [Lottia gigantea]